MYHLLEKQIRIAKCKELIYLNNSLMKHRHINIDMKR